MRHITKYLFALTALMILHSTCGVAQSRENKITKQEMVREMLKEKCRGGSLVTNANHPLAKLTKTTGYDSRVSTSGSGFVEGEVSIVVCPTDSNKLIISYMEQSGSGLEFPIYYSSNGGQTWTQSAFSPLAQLGLDFPGGFFAGGGDPAFAWDKNGKVYFAWIYLSVNASQDTAFFTLNWAYSTDNGATWDLEAGANHFIGRGALDPSSSNIFNYFDGITDREWLTIDNTSGPHQGNLYCSFVNFPPGSAGGGEAIKVKTAAATHFGPMVSAYAGETQFGNVEVDKNGVLHMSVADVGTEQIIHVASTNGGAGFSSSSTVSHAIDLQPQQTSHIVHSRENSAPNLATDGAGNLHLVWSDFPGGVVTSYYSRSTDGGATWSNPVVIDSMISGQSGQGSIMPTVAAYGNSVAISVTSYTGFPGVANFYQVISGNNGQTFGAPLTLSSAPTDYTQYTNNTSDFFGDYFRSVRSHCETYVTWSDGRLNLGPKIYFAKTTNCALAGNVNVPEITVVNNGLQLGAVYPNPAKDMITLQMSDVKEEDISIQLFDVNSKKILEQKSALHKGAQQIQLRLNDIAPGAYILSVSDKDGVVATRHIAVR